MARVTNRALGVGAALFYVAIALGIALVQRG